MVRQGGRIDNRAIAEHAEICVDPVALSHDAQLGKTDGLQIRVGEIRLPDLKSAVPDPILQAVSAMFNVICSCERRKQTLGDAGRDL